MAGNVLDDNAAVHARERNAPNQVRLIVRLQDHSGAILSDIGLKLVKDLDAASVLGCGRYRLPLAHTALQAVRGAGKRWDSRHKKPNDFRE